jgi:tetratricopeptide (TPR) repeat protein
LETDGQSSNVYYQIMDFNYMGMVFYTVCAYHKALEYFNQAQDIQRSMHFHDPLLEANYGVCLMALGQVDEGLARLAEAVALPHQNAYMRHLVHLTRLAGLAKAGKYAECIDSASKFTVEVCERNPILLGRGLLWQGVAEHALGVGNPQETLQRALDNELLYGGRDIWLCYYALARVCDDAGRAAEYYANAARILNALASSLGVQPELQTTLFNPAFRRMVFDQASNKV